MAVPHLPIGPDLEPRTGLSHPQPKEQSGAPRVTAMSSDHTPALAQPATAPAQKAIAAMRDTLPTSSPPKDMKTVSSVNLGIPRRDSRSEVSLTRSIHDATLSEDEQEIKQYRLRLSRISKDIRSLQVMKSSNSEITRVNKVIVPKLLKLIEEANGALSTERATVPQANSAELDDEITLRPSVPPRAPVASADESELSESELNNFLEAIGQHIDGIVERSRKGYVAEASTILNRLKAILDQLVDQYNALQEEAPNKNIKRIRDIEVLFSKYKFSTLRNYFWRLSLLSETHCDKEKKQSLTYVIKCLENDPINPISEPGLLELLANVVNLLNDLYKESSNVSSTTTIQQASVDTTANVLRIFTFILEVCAWHNEKDIRIPHNDALIQKASEVLDTINKCYPESSIAERNFKVWDLRLHYSTARAALQNLAADRNKLKSFFDFIPPLTKSLSEAMAKGDTILSIEGIFKIIFRKEKTTPVRWYADLFKVRKVVRLVTNDSDKVKFLQTVLNQKTHPGFTWEFAQGILELLGRIGLTTESEKLRYYICVGQKASKNFQDHLPGLLHFHQRRVALYPPSSQKLSICHAIFVAELAKQYGRSIVSHLPSSLMRRELEGWLFTDDFVQDKQKNELFVTRAIKALEKRADEYTRTLSDTPEHKRSSSSSMISTTSVTSSESSHHSLVAKKALAATPEAAVAKQVHFPAVFAATVPVIPPLARLPMTALTDPSVDSAVALIPTVASSGPKVAATTAVISSNSAEPAHVAKPHESMLKLAHGADLNATDIVSLMEQIGQDLDVVIMRSKQGPVADASGIVHYLKILLDQLMNEYRALQKEAPEAIEKRITALFTHYQFSSLRNYFWRLTGLSSIHCHKEKEESFSCLVRCLENDPILLISQHGFVDLMDNVVTCLNDLYQEPSSLQSLLKITASEYADKNITNRFLQIFTLMSEIYAWHNKNIKTINLEHWFIEKMRKMIATIDRHYSGYLDHDYAPEPKLDTILSLYSDDFKKNNYPKEYSYPVWDVKLQYTIAKAAMDNLEMEKLNALFGVVTPCIEYTKKFMSDQNQDITRFVQVVFKQLDDNYSQRGSSKIHPEWYVSLFAVRKIVDLFANHSEKVEFMQVSLLVRSPNLSWGFAGGVLHLLGKIGLETESEKLRYDICAGQQTKNSLEPLPGLLHFHQREVPIRRTIVTETHEDRKTYLSQLAKKYGLAIVERLTQQNPNVIQLEKLFLSENSVNYKLNSSGELDLS